jgi:hypothetical protein
MFFSPKIKRKWPEKRLSIVWHCHDCRQALEKRVPDAKYDRKVGKEHGVDGEKFLDQDE